MSVKILVVDDEPDLELLVRQKFRRQIRAGQFTFSFARNGLDALQHLHADAGVDLVLTDINMPEMDGLTLLGKLNELDRVLKTVVVSAYGDMENIRTAMNRGAADFLTKPIDFTDMEVTIDKTVQQLQALRHAVHEHDQLVSLRRDLDIAREIQRSILPSSFPPFPHRRDIELFAEMIPARDVGGDFYDFFLIDDARLGLVIADVSGKGMPAALFMAVSRTMLKSTALDGHTPAACLQRVNTLLCADNAAEMFVTVFYGILDTRTGTLTYSNGGHNPPYLLRRDGAAEALPGTGNMVLGVFETAPYREQTATLAPGETLFLYTDGITEAMDADDRMFSDARLATLLTSRHGAGPDALVQAVVAAVQAHSGAAPQSDDLTALALRFAGTAD